MADSIETPDQTPPPQTENQPVTMAETEQQPQSQSSTTKPSSVSFSIWPPSDRTREAVRNRLIETLSTPSILSKRYGTVSRDEAEELAKKIEEEAYEFAGKNAAAGGDEGENDGIEILQVYSKEISRKMLDTVKARSGGGASAGEVKVEEEDVGSTAPPQSEKTESVTAEEE